MKYRITPLLLTFVLFLTACKQKNGEVRSVMIMDSVYTTDENVTIVGPKDTIRLVESMKDFEKNPNITATDIDAGTKIPSAEIQYVRPGDTIRLEETQPKKGN